MISSALNFLLNTLASLLTLLFLLRFFMQLCKAPFKNPLGQMVISLTNFAVMPVRKLVPSLGKIDLSTLLLAFLTQLLLQIGLHWLSNQPFSLEVYSAWPSVIGLGFIGVLRATLDLFSYAIFLQALLSWVSPYNLINAPLDSLSKPILAPIRKYVPIINGFDISPLIAIFILQMISLKLL